MPTGRVMIAFVIGSAALAGIVYVLYKYFGHATIVPTAKVTKWEYEETKKAVKKAKKILKEDGN